VFVAVVTGVHTRRIVGWSIRDNLQAEIVGDAVAISAARRLASMPIGNRDEASQAIRPQPAGLAG
jgi:hypothetical protein